MKKLYIVICLFIFATYANATVLFEDNFDSQDDWTETQSLSSSSSCYSACGAPVGWLAYYNGYNHCNAGITNRPGNNNIYLDTYAGYPLETNPAYSGVKCLTYWPESCTDQFEDGDGNIGVDLGQEYADVYLRFKIRFKDNFEFQTASGMQFKLYHAQHYVTGTEPFAYLGDSEVFWNNRPVASGGISHYGGTNMYFYSNARYQNNYYEYNDILWDLGTIADNRSTGLLDGEWHTLELRFVRNSAVGVADGSMQLWIDGTLKSFVPSYEANTIEWNDEGDREELRGFRFFGVGGNQRNQWDTATNNDMSDHEQWYSLDDVVVADSYVGTDYIIGGSAETTATSIKANSVVIE